MPKRTKKEVDFLVKNYPQKGKMRCVKAMGKTEGQIRSKASDLGLKQDTSSDFFKSRQEKAKKSKIGKKRPEHSKKMKKYYKEGKIKPPKTTMKARKDGYQKYLKENGHPKGFLGGKHTEDTKEKLSKKSKKMRQNPFSLVNSDDHRQKLSDRMSDMQQKGKMRKRYSRAKSGRFQDGDRKFYMRSEREKNYAIYLNYLISQGYIKERDYEPKTFWFDHIKRGVRSYKPDFLVIFIDGKQERHEVKGRMDAKSKTKIKRFNKYYPDEKLVIIGAKEYKVVKQIVDNLGTK